MSACTGEDAPPGTSGDQGPEPGTGGDGGDGGTGPDPGTGGDGGTGPDPGTGGGGDGGDGGTGPDPDTSMAPSKNPQFSWFEYEGKDPVYQEFTAGEGEYSNPILAGFYPDPSICRVGEDYYLVNSSFSYFPGVPIFHSRDLVHWTQLGHVLDRPSQLDLDSQAISEGIFAPAIRYHDGVFYMVTTLVGGGGNFFVTATDPAGPWSDPIWLNSVDGIDPSFFFDDNGKAYVVNNGPPAGESLYDGHRALWIQEFDVETQKMVGPRSVIVDGGVDISKKPIWIEGPHVFKVDGTYYLIAAEGGTGDQHSEVVFRSASVTGPYEPYAGNPILTQRHLDRNRPFPVTSTGHADFVQLPNGDWWSVFLGTRPYEGDLYNTGRETFLMPVRWVDGWPVITAGTETVPYVHDTPALPPQPAPAIPMSGNFTYRDEFDGDELAPTWNFIRTPVEQWHDLTASPGWLTLKARPAHLGQRQQPSFVGRRQQHGWASASTAMKYLPSAPGDAAGLVAFQNDDFYYFLGVTLADGKPVIQLEKKAGSSASGDPQVIASAPLDLSAGAPIHLKIEAQGAAYSFSYAREPGAWVSLLEEVDGKTLSTQQAGGFVGTYIGLYAYTEQP
ncbi:glycoside hydrolase family 43 protein [Sorangium sp. So ce118]